MGLFSSIVKIGTGIASVATGGVAGAAIGAAGSLVGGALDRKDAKDAAKEAQKVNQAAADKARAQSVSDVQAMNDYNDPKNVRARAEAAGFNPLLFVGPGVGNQTALPSTYAPAVAPRQTGQMGTAISNSALLIGDEMRRRSEEVGRVSQLEQKNRDLTEQLNNSKLRPKVAGIFGVGGERLSSPGQTGHIMGPLTVSPAPMRSPVTVDRSTKGGVEVFDSVAGAWANISHGIADRLGLSEGDTMIASDYEELYGDEVGQAIMMPGMATGAFRSGGVANPFSDVTGKIPTVLSSRRNPRSQSGISRVLKDMRK